MYVTKRHGVDVYRCTPYADGRGCPRPAAVAEAVEAAVVARFMGAAGAWPEVREVVTDTAIVTASELADIEAAIRETTAALAADDANVPALLSRLDALKFRRTEVRAVPATVTTRLERTGRTLAEAFAASDDLDWRRDVLRNAFDHVTIAMSSRRGPVFDHSRVGYAEQEPPFIDDDGDTIHPPARYQG
jgi:hypothetical protein